jgi:Na+/phosphate symporter
MVLSFSCAYSLIAAHVSLVLQVVPLITFFLGAFAAVLGYLQREKSDIAPSDAKIGGSGIKRLDDLVTPTPAMYLNQIRAIADGIVGRLSSQTAKLGFRANLNLSVGVFICLIGFLILAYFVFVESKPDDHFEDHVKEAIFRFGIRLSLVLFIEVFAFFFLSLYRAGLFDIKYFQNELTNAGFRLAAIEIAFAKGDAAVIKKLCEEMSSTERNFVLKKNETTHDLRQAEMILENEKSVVNTLAKVLGSSMGHAADKKESRNCTVNPREAEADTGRPTIPDHRSVAGVGPIGHQRAYTGGRTLSPDYPIPVRCGW